MAYNVGDVVVLDNIESVIIYDAGSEQEWGRYIVTDRFYNLSHYTQNSNNFYNLSLHKSLLKYYSVVVSSSSSTDGSSLGVDEGVGVESSSGFLATTTFKVVPLTIGLPAALD